MVILWYHKSNHNEAKTLKNNAFYKNEGNFYDECIQSSYLFYFFIIDLSVLYSS